MGRRKAHGAERMRFFALRHALCAMLAQSINSLRKQFISVVFKLRGS